MHYMFIYICMYIGVSDFIHILHYILYVRISCVSVSRHNTHTQRNLIRVYLSLHNHISYTRKHTLTHNMHMRIHIYIHISNSKITTRKNPQALETYIQTYRHTMYSVLFTPNFTDVCVLTSWYLCWLKQNEESKNTPGCTVHVLETGL